MGLDEHMKELRRALHGLTGMERRYQPNPESHHIDFTVWHMARVEDDWIQRFARRTDTVWYSDEWTASLDLHERDNGVGYTPQQVLDLPPFDMDLLISYFDSVRSATLTYISQISEADLETCPHPGKRPGYTIGKMLSHILVEESQHTGQVAYIRGIQKGING